MYPKLRSLHLLTALFCLPFLLMYVLSGVQLAHRRWFPLRSRVVEQTLKLPPGIVDARMAARELPLRGELAAVFVTTTGLQFRIVRTGAVVDVAYSASTGETRIRTTTAGFAGMLNRIHQTQGMWHEYAPLNAWSGVLGLVSLGLLGVGATGLYLWFRNHDERWIGFVLLAAGAGLAGTLIVSMRM